MDKLPTEVNLSDDKGFQMSDELAERLSYEVEEALISKYGRCPEAYGYELKAVDISWEDDED